MFELRFNGKDQEGEQHEGTLSQIGCSLDTCQQPGSQFLDISHHLMHFCLKHGLQAVWICQHYSMDYVIGWSNNLDEPEDPYKYGWLVEELAAAGI